MLVEEKKIDAIQLCSQCNLAIAESLIVCYASAEILIIFQLKLTHLTNQFNMKHLIYETNPVKARKLTEQKTMLTLTSTNTLNYGIQKLRITTQLIQTIVWSKLHSLL